MTDKIIKAGMGLKLIEHEDKTYSYYMDEMCIMERLPEFMKHMMIKSYENLYKIRKEEEKKKSEQE